MRGSSGFNKALAMALAMLGVLCAARDDAVARRRARPEVSRDWKACYGAPTPREKIDGCTRAIESGRSVLLSLAYTNRGLSYAELGDVERAAFDFRQGVRYADEEIRRSPRNASIYLARATGYFGLGEYDNAIADNTEAIRLKPRAPDDSIAYANRASNYIGKRNYDAAIADFDQALRLSEIGTGKVHAMPVARHFYVGRAWAHYRKGNLEEARADADMALVLDPRHTIAYRVRGCVHLARGVSSAALSDFTEAVSLGSAEPEAFAGRGAAYEAVGKPDLALADYRQALLLAAMQPDAREAQSRARERIAALEASAPPPVSMGLPSPRIEAASPDAGATDAASGRRIALVIGNAAYRNVPSLPNPAADASAIAAAFRRLGFAEVTERHDLDLNALLSALKDFGDRAEGAEWAVIYFAGHGVEVGGQNYLLPVDARLLRASHVEDEAAPLDRVLAKTRGARKLKLVILDACRINPFAPRMAQDTGAGRAVGRGLARVEPSGGVLVAYAARDGSIADDGSGPHSPYTWALLDHLERPGLEISLLFRQVRDAVLFATGGRQEPFTYGSLPGEGMYFKASAR